MLAGKVIPILRICMIVTDKILIRIIITAIQYSINCSTEFQWQGLF